MMATRTISESLFEQLCAAHGVPCDPIPTGAGRTPDYLIQPGGVRVTCEVKQIDPNDADREELQTIRSSEATGRYVPNRLRAKLKASHP